MIIEKINDWVILALCVTIMTVTGYGIWADLLDGKYLNPILEFGTRSQQYTHETTKKVYHPGEMVYAKVLFHKNRNLIGIIQWHLINKMSREYPARQGSLPVGVWDKVVRIETIPEDALPGEHWFCGTVSYKPNWLGFVEYPVWSTKFEVVK